MPNRLLEANGTHTSIADDHLSDAVELAGETDSGDIDTSVRSAAEIVVTFPSSADGRGFSLGAELREGDGFKGKLFATGTLNPDQLSLAFQCGFDAVVISEAQWERYGEAAWVRAMDPFVNKTYVRTHWKQLDPIWERRSTTQGS